MPAAHREMPEAHSLYSQDLKPKYSQLAEDTEADICVVGGGITGLCVAYSLQKSGEQDAAGGADCV